MTTTTKARPTRLESAQAELERARNAADALRARQLESGDVPAAEFGEAGHALELAELALTGAEEEEARRAQQHRVAALGKIKAEQRADADADEFAAAYEGIAGYVARMVATVGPARSARIGQRIRAARELSVPEKIGNAPCRDEDNGVSWMSPGQLNAARLVIDGRAIGPVDLRKVILAAVAKGFRDAGHEPRLAGLSDASPALPSGLELKDNPREWATRNL